MKLATAILSAATLTIAAAHADEVLVTLDEARLHEVERPIGSIVVANPAIADITVHSADSMFLFGKMPGATVIYLFDQNGEPIDTLSVRVQNSQRNRVTVFAGPKRMTLTCTAVCEPTITVGDGVDGYLNGVDVGAVAQTRFGYASASGEGGVTSTSSTSVDGAAPEDTPAATATTVRPLDNSGS